MKKGDYIKHFEKRMRMKAKDTLMVHSEKLDADGDPLYSSFSKTQVDTAKENGWKVASKTVAPAESVKVAMVKAEKTAEEIEFAEWKAAKAKKAEKEAAEAAKKAE